MPRPKPSANTGTADVNAMIECVAPAILELLADGMPRIKPAIVEALAGRHDKQDVVHALIRLAVTGRVEESGGRYALAAVATARSSSGSTVRSHGWRRRVPCLTGESSDSVIAALQGS